jgi:hypothetical protein
VTDLEDAERRIRVALEPMPVDARRKLLEILMVPEAERTAAIGELYRATNGGQASERSSTSRPTGAWR